MEDSEPKPPEADQQPQNAGRPLGAFLVFLVVMFAIHVAFCWRLTAYYPNSWLRESQEQTVLAMYRLAERLEQYRKEHGVFPDCLDKLFTEQDRSASMKKYDLSDGWKHPLFYTTDGRNWQIYSLGSDGRPGGAGIERDIYCNNEMFVAGTIKQAAKHLTPTLRQIFTSEFWRDMTFFFSGPIFSLLILSVSYLKPLWKLQAEQRWREAAPYWIGLLFGMTVLVWFFAMIAMIPAARK